MKNLILLTAASLLAGCHFHAGYGYGHSHSSYHSSYSRTVHVSDSRNVVREPRHVKRNPSADRPRRVTASTPEGHTTTEVNDRKPKKRMKVTRGIDVRERPKTTKRLKERKPFEHWYSTGKERTTTNLRQQWNQR